jgi:hypothetical protein
MCKRPSARSLIGPTLPTCAVTKVVSYRRCWRRAGRATSTAVFDPIRTSAQFGQRSFWAPRSAGRFHSALMFAADHLAHFSVSVAMNSLSSAGDVTDAVLAPRQTAPFPWDRPTPKRRGAQVGSWVPHHFRNRIRRNRNVRDEILSGIERNDLDACRTPCRVTSHPGTASPPARSTGSSSRPSARTLQPRSRTFPRTASARRRPASM